MVVVIRTHDWRGVGRARISPCVAKQAAPLSIGVVEATLRGVSNKGGTITGQTSCRVVKCSICCHSSLQSWVVMNCTLKAVHREDRRAHGVPVLNDVVFILVVVFDPFGLAHHSFSSALLLVGWHRKPLPDRELTIDRNGDVQSTGVVAGGAEPRERAERRVGRVVLAAGRVVDRVPATTRRATLKRANLGDEALLIEQPDASRIEERQR